MSLNFSLNTVKFFWNLMKVKKILGLLDELLLKIISVFEPKNPFLWWLTIFSSFWFCFFCLIFYIQIFYLMFNLFLKVLLITKITSLFKEKLLLFVASKPNKLMKWILILFLYTYNSLHRRNKCASPSSDFWFRSLSILRVCDINRFPRINQRDGVL